MTPAEAFAHASRLGITREAMARNAEDNLAQWRMKLRAWLPLRHGHRSSKSRKAAKATIADCLAQLRLGREMLAYLERQQ